MHEVERAARAAAAVIAAAGEREVRHKGAVDLVTQVDLAAEAAIREVLEPTGVPVLAEEGGGAWHAATRFVVDPLDGTTNFVHGFPSYGPSVALQEDGLVTAACIIDVANGRCYTALAGRGATCDGQRLSVSDRDELRQCLVVTGFGYDRWERPDRYLDPLRAVMQRCRGIRRIGAAALDLCHVAAGHFDAFWEFGLRPWDVAAGKLLVEEAGGRVGDMDGGSLDLDRPRLLATNGRVHDQLREVLEPFLEA